jgi:transposase
LALAGQCTEHHARLIQGALELIDVLDRQSAALDEQIGTLAESLAPHIEQLESIPGVETPAARAIFAEIGQDMRRFGSATRLSAWAGMAPGHHESAGKRRRGKSRKGNRYLRCMFVQCAWAARKTSTCLGRTFRRLEGRIGKKQAAVAVGRTIVVLMDHVLREGTFDEEERYDRLRPQEEERQRKRAIKALEPLGYAVKVARRVA